MKRIAGVTRFPSLVNFQRKFSALCESRARTPWRRLREGARKARNRRPRALCPIFVKAVPWNGLKGETFRLLRETCQLESRRADTIETNHVAVSADTVIAGTWPEVPILDGWRTPPELPSDCLLPQREMAAAYWGILLLLFCPGFYDFFEILQPLIRRICAKRCWLVERFDISAIGWIAQFILIIL